MARKITPRHVAKTVEAERKIPKPARFNQRVSDSDNPNYMYALNKDIPDGLPDALDFHMESAERTITETVNSVEIGIRFTVRQGNPTAAFESFITRIAESPSYMPDGRVVEIAEEHCFQYEGTIYNVTDVSVDTDIGGTFGNDVFGQPSDRVTITITAVALPQIIKIKRG